jgi:hypothetical protein
VEAGTASTGTTDEGTEDTEMICINVNERDKRSRTRHIEAAERIASEYRALAAKSKKKDERAFYLRSAEGFELQAVKLRTDREAEEAARNG